MMFGWDMEEGRTLARGEAKGVGGRLTTWPAPNLRLLNSTLAQSDAGIVPLTRDSWRRAVLQRLAAISWSGVSADVRPFLEREQEMANREDVMALLAGT